jgi:hypothetical protein
VAIVPAAGSKQFSIQTPSLPKILADTSIQSFRVTYSPANSLPDSAVLEIKYTVGTQAFTVDTKLRGFVKPGFNVQLSKDLNLLLSSDCSKLDTFVSVKSSPCGADTIVNAKLLNGTSFTITSPVFPAGIPASGSFQIPVSIQKLPSGLYTDTLILTILSGGITKDTSIIFNAQILSSSEPRTNLSSGSVKFDTVSVCNFVLDTITLKNTLCKKLFIKNISVQPSSAATEFQILNTALFPDSLAQKDTAIAIIKYTPTIGGKISGTICFSIGFDLVNTKDTCITISGIGKALPGTGLGMSLLSFPTTVPCTIQALSTQLINNGCGFDTIVGVIPSKDISFSVLSPTPPLTIASGDSTAINIQEDALSPGSKFDSAGIIIHSSTGSIDTVYIKSAVTVDHPIHKLDLDVLLKIDSLAPCTAFDTTMQIKNLGTCDTIVINSFDLSGANWMTIDNLTLPVKILPGGSFSYTLHLTPGAKAGGTATISIKGIGIDTMITITASSRIGGSILTVTADSLFGSSLCKPAVHTFSLQNTSCDPIIFDKLTMTGSKQFTSSSVIVLPDTLLPGGKQDINISFDPTITGDSIGTFTYRSTISGISRTISLTGKLATSKQTARLGLVTGVNQTSATIQTGGTFTISIVLQDNIDPTLGLQSVAATLVYYKDILGITNNPITAGGGWNLISTVPANPNGTLTVNLQPNGASGLSKGSVLVTIPFQVFVADSDHTPIDLQNISFNNSDTVFQSCVLAPLGMSSPFQLTTDPLCGDKTLRSFMEGNTIFTNITIRPNPAPGGSQINVCLLLNEKADIKLLVFDALGRIVTQNSVISPEKGIQNIILDLPKDANGLYMLSVEAGGMQETREIIVEK